MRITKFAHACVRVEHEGTTIVIDSSMFTNPEALDDADGYVLTLRRRSAPLVAHGPLRAHSQPRDRQA